MLKIVIKEEFIIIFMKIAKNAKWMNILMIKNIAYHANILYAMKELLLIYSQIIGFLPYKTFIYVNQGIVQE